MAICILQQNWMLLNLFHKVSLKYQNYRHITYLSNNVVLNDKIFDIFIKVCTSCNKYNENEATSKSFLNFLYKLFHPPLFIKFYFIMFSVHTQYVISSLYGVSIVLLFSTFYTFMSLVFVQFMHMSLEYRPIHVLHYVRDI